MASRRLSTLLGTVVVVGCYSPPDAPRPVQARALETTQLVFQAVDAGTGSALSDAEMTVRYLVRAPINFDIASVQELPSVEQVQIAHEVGEENLVLEVRLEAESYFRLDTVFTVPRGTTAGPLTMRLSRRLGRVADVTPGPTPPSPGPVVQPPTGGQGRAAMQRGDAAYSREQWLEATEAYQQMPRPEDETNEYGRDFIDARVRQGVAHINRSEFGRALEIFEEVTAMQNPGPDAYLRLAESQCAVGRTEEGRGTLSQVGRARSRLTPVEQSYVSAMIAYRRGVCSNGEFDRAQTTRDRVRSGAQAIQELNAFVEGARAMSPVPPAVYNAVQDAERRVADIRRRQGRGDV